MRFSPFIVEVRSALSARPLALSDDVADCAAVLTRILARRRRETRSAIDTITAAALAAEVERIEKILALTKQVARAGTRGGR